MINAGQLNRRVEICELTDGINPETGRDEGQKYVPVCTVWANVKHVRGFGVFYCGSGKCRKNGDVYNQIQKNSDRGPLYKIRWDIL